MKMCLSQLQTMIHDFHDFLNFCDQRVAVLDRCLIFQMEKMGGCIHYELQRIYKSGMLSKERMWIHGDRGPLLEPKRQLNLPGVFQRYERVGKPKDGWRLTRDVRCALLKKSTFGEEIDGANKTQSLRLKQQALIETHVLKAKGFGSL